jgi:hypothetical protein
MVMKRILRLLISFGLAARAMSDAEIHCGAWDSDALRDKYNPAAASTAAKNLGQWMNAVMSMKSDGGTMTVADAVAMVRATPPKDRSRFAREIWARRRAHGTNRSDRSVPF